MKVNEGKDRLDHLGAQPGRSFALGPKDGFA